MKPESSEKLTVPDLVVLSLLAERAMYGYQINELLEFRKVRDWAGVSRPQLYYSIEKLARLELIRPVRADGDSKGPERQVYETNARGRAALAGSLERDDWTDQTDRPAFLIWLALSWKCREGVFDLQLSKRQAFLKKELVRRQEILVSVLAEVGHRFHEAVWMLTLSIEQIRTELRWIGKVARESSRRASAQSPLAAKK